MQPIFKTIPTPRPFCPKCGDMLTEGETLGDWHYTCHCGQWIVKDESKDGCADYDVV
jgi:hypothetical protein